MESDRKAEATENANEIAAILFFCSLKPVLHVYESFEVRKLKPNDDGKDCHYQAKWLIASGHRRTV